MTYLEMVNAVLRRLRERTVSTHTATVYSTMVGDFINDAKAEVEKAWTWGELRKDYTEGVSAGDTEANFTGMGKQAKIISLWNNTSDTPMIQKSQRWMDKKKYGGETVTGTPKYYCYREKQGGDNVTLEVWPEPDATYQLKANTYVHKVT